MAVYAMDRELRDRARCRPCQRVAGQFSMAQMTGAYGAVYDWTHGDACSRALKRYVASPESSIPATRTYRRSELINQMTDAITHRGPDESGVFTSEPGLAPRSSPAVGHRHSKRAATAVQCGPQRRNRIQWRDLQFHVQLRPELEALGYRFRRTPTPRSSCTPGRPGATNAYNVCAACSHSPSGTKKHRHLFLARDRLGIKPLYYALLPTDTSCSVRSSRPCCHTRHCRAAYLMAIEDYFAYGYVPNQDHILGRAQTSAGHTLLIEKGQTRFPEPISTGTFRSPTADWRHRTSAQSELIGRLREAIDIRLVARCHWGRSWAVWIPAPSLH